MLIQTAVLSLLTKLCLKCIPFRYLAPRLGAENQKSAFPALTPKQQQQVAQVEWAVAVIGRRTRWKNRCLVDAITAKWLLSRYGISARLSLGIAKDSKRNLQAHAWLQAGDVIVTGKNEFERFQILTTFV